MGPPFAGPPGGGAGIGSDLRDRVTDALNEVPCGAVRRVADLLVGKLARQPGGVLEDVM